MSTITVEASKKYDIIVEENLLPRTGEEMEFIKEPPHTFPWHLF